MDLNRHSWPDQARPYLFYVGTPHNFWMRRCIESFALLSWPRRARPGRSGEAAGYSMSAAGAEEGTRELSLSSVDGIDNAAPVASQAGGMSDELEGEEKLAAVDAIFAAGTLSFDPYCICSFRTMFHDISSHARTHFVVSSFSHPSRCHRQAQSVAACPQFQPRHRPQRLGRQCR